MQILRYFPLLLLLMPILEISVFVLVGQRIGLLPTITGVVLTAIAGAVMLRIQGFAVLRRLQQASADGGLPVKELADGFFIFIAALLLLTPGFVTDTLGLLLFIPAVRNAIRRAIASRVTIMPLGEACRAVLRHAVRRTARPATATAARPSILIPTSFVKDPDERIRLAPEGGACSNRTKMLASRKFQSGGHETG